MKASKFMQGRYYAGRRINVEFRTIPSWASAICGMSVSFLNPISYEHMFLCCNTKKLLNFLNDFIKIFAYDI
jgi:hypothetical protein